MLQRAVGECRRLRRRGARLQPARHKQAAEESAEVAAAADGGQVIELAEQGGGGWHGGGGDGIRSIAFLDGVRRRLLGNFVQRRTGHRRRWRLGQCLHHAQAERRAADSAAGKA